MACSLDWTQCIPYRQSEDMCVCVWRLRSCLWPAACANCVAQVCPPVCFEISSFMRPRLHLSGLFVGRLCLRVVWSCVVFWLSGVRDDETDIHSSTQPDSVLLPYSPRTNAGLHADSYINNLCLGSRDGNDLKFLTDTRTHRQLLSSLWSKKKKTSLFS